MKLSVDFFSSLFLGNLWKVNKEISKPFVKSVAECGIERGCYYVFSCNESFRCVQGNLWYNCILILKNQIVQGNLWYNYVLILKNQIPSCYECGF